MRKERTVFTKQRAEVYSRERYTITKKEVNMYTLSGEYEGRDIFTHHITVKVVSKEDELEKRLVKEKEVKVEAVDKEPVPEVKKVKTRLIYQLLF